MQTIRLSNTPHNRYVKEVLDHLQAYHRDSSFGYDDIPGNDRGLKSTVMVELKQMGLRDSVAYLTFALTERGKTTKIEVD